MSGTEIIVLALCGLLLAQSAFYSWIAREGLLSLRQSCELITSSNDLMKQAFDLLDKALPETDPPSPQSGGAE